MSELPRQQISAASLRLFQPQKTFHFHGGHAPVTLLDFDDLGTYLLLCGVDELLQLYDVMRGKHVKLVMSKKYGCHLARFTHSEKLCLHITTSVNEDHAIRHLSLHDKTYIRYYKGHTGFVTLLEMCPSSDVFMSALRDRTLRLWDLRLPLCQGLMNTPLPHSTVQFDNQGMIFVAANPDNNSVGLYDLRSYENARPFSTFQLQLPRRASGGPHRWNKMEITNDGNKLVIGTTDGPVFVVDAFEGTFLGELGGAVPFAPREYPWTGSVSTTPDARYAFVGLGDYSTLVYDLKDLGRRGHAPLTPMARLPSSSAAGLPRTVLFNPRFFALATADQEVTLWTPDEAAMGT